MSSASNLRYTSVLRILYHFHKKKVTESLGSRARVYLGASSSRPPVSRRAYVPAGPPEQSIPANCSARGAKLYEGEESVGGNWERERESAASGARLVAWGQSSCVIARIRDSILSSLAPRLTLWLLPRVQCSSSGRALCVIMRAAPRARGDSFNFQMQLPRVACV